ncbi:hypothetical protein EXIGLDRAFT_775658 [Exidia glandulosa HHB12029]|uniref:Uncharacterized protein n=1 Tax=Exidia glandulosa HHB12029 TaxID=1314781 RepID=A0A165DU77_EXIGL|nr:hypothetical protein EXIGLDRAFT_775658 [Exidia glandulosa HHB12029]
MVQIPPPPSPAAAFEYLLARATKGNALWRPAAHTGSGSVGDCGYFRDGSFIKLFSVFGPPLGLSMLQLDSGDVQRHTLPNTSVVQSSSRSKITLGRGVPVGPPPHTVSGSFELVRDEPACAFLAFGGHSRIVDSGPAQKLARYLAENRRKIFERFRTEQQHATLDEDELVILHETTKAGAWLGGVAYPQGAVAGSFTLDGQGARVTVLKPRDPSALKHPASVRWEFTYGRSEGPTPSCCVVAKAVISRRRGSAGTSTSASSSSYRSSIRSRSSTWSSSIIGSGRGSRTSGSTTSSGTRSRSSTWSKGSNYSGRRLSVRALAEWNRLHPRTPMTEDDLEIRSPISPEELAPLEEESGAEEGEDDRTLLERLLDNVLREYPNIDVAVGDWSCITEYEDRHGRLPSGDVVPAFKALHTWVTPDGAHAAYLSHIPTQATATSLGFIDLRAYTTTIRAPSSTLDPRPLPVRPTASSPRRPTLSTGPSRKPSMETLPLSSGSHSRKQSEASFGTSSGSMSSMRSTDAGRRLRAGSVLVAMSVPAPAKRTVA